VRSKLDRPSALHESERDLNFKRFARTPSDILDGLHGPIGLSRDVRCVWILHRSSVSIHSMQRTPIDVEPAIVNAARDRRACTRSALLRKERYDRRIRPSAYAGPVAKKDVPTKDLVTGSASTGTAMVATAAASGSSAAVVLAGVLAFIPTIFGLGVDRIRSRSERRAQRLLEHMTEADPDPQGFVEGLRARLEADDPDLVSALRSLLAASVESVSDAAIEPMAMIGRAHIRGECPTWIARGWLRILAELTEVEIADLRALVEEGKAMRARSLAEYRRILRVPDAQWTPNVRLRMRPLRRSSGVSVLFLVPDIMPSGVTSIADLTKPIPLAEQPTFAAGFAERLYAQLHQHHLCWLDDRPRLHAEERYEREAADKEAAAEDQGRRKFIRRERFEHPDDLTFDDECFSAIATAFPA
jgi:hypothetical protein